MLRSTHPVHRTTLQAPARRHLAAARRGAFIRLSPAALLLLAGCVLVPPGTSTGDVAARRQGPPIALGASDLDAPAWSGSAARTATRSADLVRVAADLTLDLEATRIYGSATSTLRMMRTGVETLSLDAEGIEVREIVDGDGRALGHRVLPGRIEVTLEEPVAVGDEVAITVRYVASGPGAIKVSLEDRGAFRPEAFALGDGGGLGRWLPTSAPAGELAAVELALTVGDGLAVVSNGQLAGVDDLGGGAAATPERVYRWRQLEPIPVDAIVLAAGRFETFASEAGPTALYFHLPEGTDEAVAGQSFGESAAVLGHFETRLRQRFPFPRYDQVVLRTLDARLQDGATLTMSDASELSREADVLDERRERPRRAVSRGLARKWFGAWLAPLGERHRWLLDGLACQLELDYEAVVRGEAEVALEWEELRERLVRRSRDMAAPGATAEDPELARELDAFRAGWALRVIRGRLGEEDFWRLVRRFAARPAEARLVTGEDFRRAALAELGVDLGPELAQWARRTGVPELEVQLQRREVVAAGESLGVLVRQVQPGPLFRVALDVELHFEDGTSRTETMVLDREETLLVVRLDRPLIDVTVDPAGALLAGVSVEKDESSWLAQGLLSRPAVQRRRALPELERLATNGSAAAAQSLVRLLLESPEPGLREQAAGSFTFPGPTAIAALLRSASEDASPGVRAASLRGLYQAHAAERWLPSDDDVQELLALRQREVSPSALAQIERLLDTIPGG